MTKHKERAEERAKNKDPINFTCGLCRQVHPFDAESPYGCPVEKSIQENSEAAEKAEDI